MDWAIQRSATSTFHLVSERTNTSMTTDLGVAFTAIATHESILIQQALNLVPGCLCRVVDREVVGADLFACALHDL
jgi:hypothetical protein